MKNEYSHILKKAGLKVTSARLSILETFSADCKPVNAEYIYEKLKGKDINLVTIYRTLSTLEKGGVLKRVDLRKGAICYELAFHHHHHLTCTDCGETEVFEACDIEKISKQILDKSSSFKMINQHSLELFGLCKSCSKG